MILETISQRDTTLVRRLVLEPGSAMPLDIDPYHRVTVVIRGEVLAIEYRDGLEAEHGEVTAGQSDWDEPTDQVHRAVNVGQTAYEESHDLRSRSARRSAATNRRLKRPTQLNE